MTFEQTPEAAEEASPIGVGEGHFGKSTAGLGAGAEPGCCRKCPCPRIYFPFPVTNEDSGFIPALSWDSSLLIQNTRVTKLQEAAPSRSSLSPVLKGDFSQNPAGTRLWAATGKRRG